MSPHIKSQRNSPHPGWLRTRLFLLPTALATSPFLLAAGQLPSSSSMTLACKLDAVSELIGDRLPERLLSESGVELDESTRLGHIVQPISTSQQAIITSQHELARMNAATPDETEFDNHCRAKEEPSADTTEEATEVPAGELPDLGADTQSQPSQQPDALPSTLPTDSSPEAIPESSDSESSDSESSDSESSDSEGSNPITDEEPATASPTPLIERPTPPPPSDPNRDPSNFTPEAPAPTPFDGIVEPTLESLPDGSYRYLSGNYEYGNYTDEQLIANGGSVFLLTKVGTQITGDLLPRLDLPGICVTGTVSGDMVSGSAYPHDAIVVETDDSARDVNSEATDLETISSPESGTELSDMEAPESKERVREIGDTFEPYGSGALQIRKSRIVDGRIYYEEAMLDLSNFSRINAGSALAPTECN